MNLPLYPTDAEIARVLFGSGKAVRDWQALAAILDRQGLPKPDPITGRRYWPAVRAYLDRRAGLRDDAPAQTTDGQERFDDRRPRTRGAAA